jgi:hypothetical protein
MPDTHEELDCESCRRMTRHSLHGTVTEEDEQEVEWESGNIETIPIEWHLLLFKCEVCKTASLRVMGDWGDKPQQVYPELKKLSGVPDAVKRSYDEARKVRRVSAIAFIALIRRALEYLCIDQRAVGRDLKEQLDYLSKNGIIPENLAKMAQEIRFFGNLGIHATQAKIDYADVHIVEDFYLAIIEYVYIAPEKLRKAQQRYKEQRK